MLMEKLQNIKQKLFYVEIWIMPTLVLYSHLFSRLNCNTAHSHYCLSDTMRDPPDPLQQRIPSSSFGHKVHMVIPKPLDRNLTKRVCRLQKIL